MDHEQFAPDRALAILVDITNCLTERQEGTGVVLTLSGLLVSGQLIPDWQWMNEVEQQVRDAYARDGSDPDKGWATLFQQTGEKLVQRREEQRSVADLTGQLPERYVQALGQQDATSFIHLRSARVYTPGHDEVPKNGMYWRGRLSEVAGWSLGLLGPQQQAR